MATVHSLAPSVPLARLGQAVAAAIAGLIFLAVTLLLEGSALGPALRIAGLALVGASIWIAARFALEQRKRAAVLDATMRLVETEDQPAFLTDASGAILKRNPAGTLRFEGSDIRGYFDDQLANPAALVDRLSRGAHTVGHAREDLLTRSNTLSVSVAQVSADHFLWRVVDLADDAHEGEALSLPMLTAGRGGAVLYMNPAFRKILGGRPRALDQIFRALPIESGQVHRVNGASGPLDAVVAEVPGPGGRREIYLLPGQAGGDKAGLDPGWDVVEELPVPLLKIALSGEILGSNSGARELLRSDIVPGTRVGDLLEGLGRPMVDWLLEAHRAPGRPQPQFLRGAGRRRDLSVQITLCKSRGGDQPHLIGVLHDVTEFKAMEAQFVQSQKMQAIGQLAGGVAHDFNNLLTAISGHCDLLLLRHDDDDPDFPDLSQIRQNTNRAAALVRQLLAYSRKQDLQLVKLDLRDTLSELTHLLNRLVGERIQLNLVHDPAPLSVVADKRQLEQVLMNLVVNARDAMPNGGEIRVESENVTLTTPLRRDRATVQPGDYVVVRVVDEGRGIPPEMIGHVFEPFYTTKGLGEGTGLGLSTAYGIIKQSGGFIFADSPPDQGATFTLYLPAHAADSEEPAAEPQLQKDEETEAGGTVLLVEDEAPVRAFASRALNLRGYQVIEAGSGEEALALLERDAPDVDLFVTDVVMPGLNGPGWVREALVQRPDTRVVFVSGYAEDRLREAREAIPNSVFLPKPFSLADLTRVVQEQIALTRSAGGSAS